jgi:parallel beta-helix repeat protein
MPPEEDEGIVVRPGDDLNSIVAAAPAGTRFLIEPGIHRIQPITPKDGMAFVGSPGTVLSGAQILEGFEGERGLWHIDGVQRTGEDRGVCFANASGCTYSQDLFMDDVMLWQVTELGDLEEGRWFWDGETIYVANDPSGRRVELSVTTHAIVGDAADVEISGLKVEKFATPAQEGTIQAQNLGDGERGKRWLIEDVEVTGSHAVGIRTGDETLVSGAYVHHNGQMGLAISGGTDVTIEDSEIAYNNIAGFDWTWEGGGMKATRTEGLIVRNNHSHNNVGPGLWTDIDAMNTLYEGNRVVDNTAMGIFHEISGPAVIRDNYVEGNGFDKPEWLWGAGIVIAASNGVEVIGNEVIDNADGIAGIQQDRQDGPGAPYLLEDVLVSGNTIRMQEGQTGVVEDAGTQEVFTDRNIVFEANTYLDISGRRFAWDGRSLDRRGWLALGQDVGANWERST